MSEDVDWLSELAGKHGLRARTRVMVMYDGFCEECGAHFGSEVSIPMEHRVSPTETTRKFLISMFREVKRAIRKCPHREDWGDEE